MRRRGSQAGVRGIDGMLCGRACVVQAGQGSRDSKRRCTRINSYRMAFQEQTIVCERVTVASVDDRAALRSAGETTRRLFAWYNEQVEGK